MSEIEMFAKLQSIKSQTLVVTLILSALVVGLTLPVGFAQAGPSVTLKSPLPAALVPGQQTTFVIEVTGSGGGGTGPGEITQVDVLWGITGFGFPQARTADFASISPPDTTPQVYVINFIPPFPSGISLGSGAGVSDVVVYQIHAVVDGEDAFGPKESLGFLPTATIVFERLDGRLAGVDNRLRDVETQFEPTLAGSLASEVASLKTTVAQNKAQSEAIRDTVNSNFDAVDADLSSIATAINQRGADITKVSNDVASLKADVDALRADVSAIRDALPGIAAAAMPASAEADPLGAVGFIIAIIAIAIAGVAVARGGK
ncbi:MAG: hypothetical protein ACE5KO_00250 [Candidatus Bathyarchaeia archaeon]